MTTEKIKGIVESNPSLRNKLFSYGFLFTSAKIDSAEYPFFGLWKTEKILDYTLLVHSSQRYYLHGNGDKWMILVGHAYDPFDFQSDENVILEQLLAFWKDSQEAFTEKFNNLSGLFTLIVLDGEKVVLFGDPTGMQTNYYGRIDNQIYISSHSRIIGDLKNLEMDEYVSKLIKYKYYPLFGNLLPGDLSPFSQIKRLVPNHYVMIEEGKIENKRFFTIDKMANTNEEIVDGVSSILNSSLKLIAKKWERPAISLTGGCDSKTTLSCANGEYDKFNYFSYISTDEEKVDARAAHDICENLGLEHKIYEISREDQEFIDLDKNKEILFWNGGGTLYNNPNDIRKRCFFSNVNDFDVEIKSWCSEVGRAYYSKRFANRKSFGKKPTPRKCTTLYKVFFTNRKLVRKTDRIFKEYISKYLCGIKDSQIPWQEHFFWEFRMPSWNGLTITGEHRYSFDITIPYNNRKLLCLLLSADIKDRIGDKIYSLIRAKMNAKVDGLGISITNVKHTSKRAKIENLYYAIHTKLPF